MEDFRSNDQPAVGIAPIASETRELLKELGGRIEPLDPIGVAVSGLDLQALTELPPILVRALEGEMARRGFLVFKNPQQLSPEDFLRISCWWGGKALHSTHATLPGLNRHIFRLSNDPRCGITGVGPQWHNDGAFNTAPFSHSGYHILRPAERGGGTWFAHQGAAFDALPPGVGERWRRLSSVNATSGAVHPLVHLHPVTDRESVWLHLGMTGAVIERQANDNGFRLLDAAELTALCREYNDLLNAGEDAGYTLEYEYEAHDCLFIDNLAVAHRASANAHRPAGEQGLRVMERSTVRGIVNLAPEYGLPPQYAIDGPNPFNTGVWVAGGIGFRWADDIAMRN